jgi:hypothetical protein
MGVLIAASFIQKWGGFNDQTALLARAAHQGLVAWCDDRADPRLIRMPNVYADEIGELLLFSGFWGCSCPKCQAAEGIH